MEVWGQEHRISKSLTIGKMGEAKFKNTVNGCIAILVLPPFYSMIIIYSSGITAYAIQTEKFLNVRFVVALTLLICKKFICQQFAK